MRLMLTTPPQDMYFFEPHELDEYKIDRPSQFAVAVSEATASPQEKIASVSARRDGARFADYKVDDSFEGEPASPQYFGEHKGARNFRTRIKNGLAQGPNFAGSWSMVEIGCGTDCRFVIPVDGRTGRITNFPIGGEENYQMELTYIPRKLPREISLEGYL